MLCGQALVFVFSLVKDSVEVCGVFTGKGLRYRYLS